MFRTLYGIDNQPQRIILVCFCTIALTGIGIHFNNSTPPLNYERSNFLMSNLLKPTIYESKKQKIHTNKPQTINKKICTPTPTLDQSYLEKSANELQNTNIEIDNLRQTAQNSGESYQSFDSQANAIFNSYNEQVTAIYRTYITALNGCSMHEPSPIIFSMFSP
jgi:hypothetical protein